VRCEEQSTEITEGRRNEHPEARDRDPANRGTPVPGRSQLVLGKLQWPPAGIRCRQVRFNFSKKVVMPVACAQSNWSLSQNLFVKTFQEANDGRELE
jgi:hypothetical protein